MKKREINTIENNFKKIREKEANGELFRDKGGLEPRDLVSLLKMKICKKIREYKRVNNLQNKDICRLLNMNDSQVSILMAVHFDKFSLDFLVEKLDVLSKHDPECARSKDILKIAC